MKEPQKSKIIALLMDYSAGVYQNKEMVDLIESILSPLPHQDGASADTNNMTQFKIGQKVKDDVRGYGEGVVTDSDGQWILVRFKGCYQNYTSCGRWKRDHVITLHPIEVEKAVADGASAEEILSAANGYPFLTILPISNWDDAIKAMHQFSKSEVAKVVAENDREIDELKYDLEKSKTAWTVSHNTAIKRRKRIAEIQDERETMIQAFNDIREQFEGRAWILEGRGSYPYNDDRYKEEVRYIFDAFQKIEKEMWRQITSKSYEYRKSIEQPLQSELSAANERIKELEDAAIINEVFKTK